MNNQKNYISPDEFQSILNGIPDLHIRKWKDEQVKMLFKISYFCALRISETIKLRKEDFDFETSLVWLGKTKSKRGASATIPSYFQNELRVYLDIQEENELFAGMNRFIVWFWTKRLGEMLDIIAWTTPQSKSFEKTKTHIFRKSYLKDMLYGMFGEKVPLNVIMQKARHTNMQTTSGYLQVNNDVVIDWENRLNP